MLVLFMNWTIDITGIYIAWYNKFLLMYIVIVPGLATFSSNV